jgi:hypothetical protein
VKDRCRAERQVLRRVGPDQLVSCWRATEGEISTDDFHRVTGSLEE